MRTAGADVVNVHGERAARAAQRPTQPGRRAAPAAITLHAISHTHTHTDVHARAHAVCSINVQERPVFPRRGKCN